MKRTSLVLGLWLLEASAVQSQPSPPPPDTATPADEAPSDLEGKTEDPEFIKNEEPTDVLATPAAAEVPRWSDQEVQRPLTLPALTAELRLDLPVRPFLFSADYILGVRFGVVDELELGIDYNIGGSYDDGRDALLFNPGKGMQLSATYRFHSMLGARLAIPMYFDPFAFGVVMGLPTKFVINKRLAFGTTGEMLGLRVYEFLPTLRSELPNEANANQIAASGNTSRGYFRMVGYTQYQWRDKTVILGQIGVELPDFGTLKVVYPLKGGIQHTVLAGRADLVGLVGFDDLSFAEDSFGFDLGVRFRL